MLRSLVVVLAALLCCASARADGVSLSALLPYGGSYVPDTWLPMRVDVQNPEAQGFEGLVRVTPSDGRVAEFCSSVPVPPHSKVRFQCWIQLPSKVGMQSPVAGVALYDKEGARLALTQISGRPLTSDVVYRPDGMASAGYLLAATGMGTAIREPDLLDGVGSAMESAMDWKTHRMAPDLSDLPRASLLYGGAYVVALTELDPAELDLAQRRAILDYVIGGGVLLVVSPDPARYIGSWIEPYLPVHLLGTRQANGLSLTTGPEQVVFPKWTQICEAVAGDGAVLWRDAEFVHAAYRKLGFGRIAYVSFQSSALDANDPEVVTLWRGLLQMDRAPVGISGTQIAGSYDRLMAPMLGRRAASWSLAAGAVMMVVVLTIVSQLVWRGADRPRAFAVSLGLCIVTALVFSAMAAFRQHVEPLQQATLSATDVCSEGSVSQQYAALVGPQQQLTQSAASPLVGLSPAMLRQDRPVVSQWPMRIAPVSVGTEQVRQVSYATGMFADITAAVRAQFTADGLRLEVDNRMGSAIGDAQLVWGSRRLLVRKLDQGPNVRVLTEAEMLPEGQFAAASGVATQDQLHKGQIVASLLRSRYTASLTPAERPALVGFVDRLPMLITTDGVQADRTARQDLVRLPVDMMPSLPGSSVRVDGCFSRIVLMPGKALPYSKASNQFLATGLQGSWPVCVQPPEQIGRLRLQHATVRIGLASPQHRITVRRGQCRQRAYQPDGSGPVVGEWDGQIGLQTVEFDCAPEDFDASGRLWLQIEARLSGAAGAIGVEPRWRIEQLMVDLAGQVSQE